MTAMNDIKSLNNTDVGTINSCCYVTEQSLNRLDQTKSAYQSLE